ncbi:MAG: Gfo/Idh/MocA family oxidoreductase [Desulfobacterales bacterium]
MSKVRAGVIGAGYLGRYHAQKYAAMPGVDLVGIVDIDEDKARTVALECSTQPLTDYQELFGRVDAVSVATTTTAHYAVGRDFLMRGIDVLMEKPMTTTLAQADELIALARANQRILQVGHLERFNPAVKALDGKVENPMFIEAHRLSLYKARCTDVSVVLDLMIHDIDIILTLVGMGPRDIHATGVPVISGEVDIANARLEFPTGCVANITCSRISAKNQRKIRFFQKDAYIAVDFAQREIVHIRRCPGKTDCLIPEMDIQQRQFEDDDALRSEIEAFVAAVISRRPSPISGEAGREALEVALKIMDQINAGSRKYWDQ